MASRTRLSSIEPFHVMRLLAKAKALESQGRDIIHMEVGEPDFPTPQPIVEAGITALKQGKTHYTSALGIPELREAISAYYDHHFAVQVDPGRIVVTSGASAALQLALFATVEPGDGVLLTDPGYPCNRHLVTLAGGEVQTVEVNESSNYQLTADILRLAWLEHSQVVLATTPSNPTGSVLSPSELRAIFGVVRQRSGMLIVDEIYQGLVYDQPDVTALSIDDDLFVVNSFSKYFGMTGWRLGWLVAPEHAVPDIDKLAQNIYLAPSTPAQYAALAAFDPATQDILKERSLELKSRRDFLRPALEELGFAFGYEPGGAFYLYAESGKFSQDSFALAEAILDDCGVAVTPGKDFGEFSAGDYLRFAYTTREERLQEAVERLGRYLPGRVLP